ncbi:hypothetical protein DYB30_012348, partial [Aphanomyces astaci]
MKIGMASKDMTTRDYQKLSPEEFLNRTKATSYMQDAVNLVLEYRPEQPLTFQMMCGDLGPIEVSAFYIQSCGTISNSSFEDTLVLAYHALKKPSTTMTDATPVGVDVHAFQQLLHLLCQDIPCAPQAKLVTYLAPSTISSVSYARFRHAIDVCLLYGEVVSEGEDLFQSVDGANAGEVKCSVLVSAMEIASAHKTLNAQLVARLRTTLERETLHDGNATISLDRFLTSLSHV